MQISKYARKQTIKSYAKNFTEAEWLTLCKDDEFTAALEGGPEVNLTAADERAKVLLPRLPVKPKPKVVTSLQELSVR